MHLLYANTLMPNTTPQSLHEIRFKKPVFLQAFRIVNENERAHDTLNGRTPFTQLVLDMFAFQHACNHSCIPMLHGPHRRNQDYNPSSLHPFTQVAATTSVDYVVVRCQLTVEHG